MTFPLHGVVTRQDLHFWWTSLATTGIQPLESFINSYFMQVTYHFFILVRLGGAYKRILTHCINYSMLSLAMPPLQQLFYCITVTSSHICIPTRLFNSWTRGNASSHFCTQNSYNVWSIGGTQPKFAEDKVLQNTRIIKL